MDMHKKIIAFAVSLEANELNGNRLILLTNAGLLSALPVYSDESDIQSKLLYQCLKSTEKALNKNYVPNSERHLLFDENSLLLKDVKLISSKSVQELGSLLLDTSSVIAISIGTCLEDQ